MKNKFKSATFLRQLTLTLIVAMLAAAFQTARAQESQVEYPEYITEVIVVGGTKDETNTAKETYEKKGYTFCAKDLNAGCGSSSDYIYLGYKTESRANTNGGYITDFVVRRGSNPPTTISYNGRTYSLCPYDGGDHFKEITGNLNSHVSSGWDLYLYYTKDNYDKRAVNSITFNNTKSGAVDLTANGTGGIDLNAGCGEDTDNIYMHITTATKSNRPSNDPVMASGLTFNGDPQALLSINNTNTGTMMYSVNDGGFSSTIPTATDAGDYTVKYYAASNDYGNQSETKSQTVSIAKATNNKVTTTAALNLTYNGSAQNLITAYSATFGTVQYSLDGINYSATVPKGTDAKTYTIYYKVAETSNYNGVSGTATATIKKTANSVTTTAALNLTYTGSAQKLINAYSATFGTVQYSFDGTTYYATIPQGTDAKDYTIYYKVEGTSNYNGVSGTAKATIKKAANSVAITEALDLTYNGSAQNLIDPYIATDGVVLYSLDNTTFSSDIPQATGAKDYTIYYKVAETPNYNGVSGTATATIKKAANNNATVSIDNSINGRENVNPTVTDNLSSGTITYKYSTSSNSDFSTAKPNAPGTWYVKATIAADDNYEEYTTATKIFTLIDWEGDGTSSSPYLIKSTTDLDLLATKVNSGYVSEGKYFKLGNNITYSYENLGETESNFTAIGTEDHPFKGNFDGDGKKISGIRIYKPYDNDQGLFGCIEAAIVENIILTDTKITGSDAVGGIVGCSSGGTGTIRNCIVADNVYINANFMCGGIVGINYGSLSNNLVVNAEINSSTNGAIVGKNVYATPINNFYYNTTVKGVNNATNVGGGNGDITENNGAVSLHTITLGEGISITSPATPTKTYDGIDYYAQGTEITLAYSSTVPEGALLHYTINDGEPTTSNKFTMPAANTTVAAAVEQYYTITLGEGISIESPTSPKLTSNGIDYYAQGTEITLSCTVPEGCALKEYKVNGSAITSNKFTMPAANTTVAAAVEQYYTITLGEGISITSPTSPALTSNGIDYYAQGTEITLSYSGTVPVGYIFNYKVNGSAITDNTFTMPAQNTTVAANIVIDPEYLVIDLTSDEPFELNNNDFDYVFDYWADTYAAYYDSYESYPVIIHSFDLDLDGTPDAEIVIGINDYNNSAIAIRLSGANSINKNISFALDYDATGYKHLVFKFGDDYQTEEAMQFFAIKDNYEWNADNIGVLVDDLNITTTNVMLQDRTLYRDGRWQTIYLPFAVDLTDEDSPLYQAIAYELQSATIEGNTITADFGSPVTQLEANVPYIIKWNENLGLEDLKNPIFMDASFDISGNSPTDIPFVGSIDMKSYVGGTIGACRAAFYVGNKPDGENFALYPATGITLNGGDLGISADDIAILTYGEPLPIENVTVLPAAYTGELLSPVLKDGDYTLEKFKDYYIDNVIYNGSHVNEIVEPGVYTVTIIGNGMYSGITTKEFVVTQDLVINLDFKGGLHIPSAQDAIVLNAWIDNNVAYIYDEDQDNEIVLLNLNFDDTPDVKLEFDENSFKASRGEGANSITTNLRFALDETLVEHFGYGHIVFMFGRSYETVDVIERKIGALTIYEYGDKTTASIDGNYTAADALSITNDINVTSVTLARDFTEGKYATVVLPFAATANASDGTFYTFEGVTYDEEKSTWVAGVSSVTSLEPHTPYIFEPKSNLTSLTWNVATTIYTKPTSAATTEVADETYGKWIFKGVYEPERWAERQTKIYGFAGADKTNRDDQEIHIGDFVRAGYNSSIRPFRCYLEYSGEGGKIDLSTLSKSSLTLPDRIEVRVINSVLEPDDPQENPNGDIETPTSEITPAANVKVWSFDKTIYIAAAPNTPYMIVDMSGRQLQTGITATSRDEIHLPGKVDGIVIVRVANQSFKIRY